MELADVIAKVESGGNQWAQRFERLHLGASSPQLLARISSANKCSQATADVYAAMSHGLFQLMGFRLYGDPQRDRRNLNYSGTVAAFMNSAELQREYFRKYCDQNGILFTVDDLIRDAVKRSKFAEVYNGPANIPNYSTQILAAIRSGPIPRVA